MTATKKVRREDIKHALIAAGYAAHYVSEEGKAVRVRMDGTPGNAATFKGVAAIVLSNYTDDRMVVIQWKSAPISTSLGS